MHRAVDKCDISLVWPEEKAISTTLKLTEHLARSEADGAKGKEKEKQAVARLHPLVDAKQIHWYDNLVSKNHEQATAVVRLVNKRQTPEDGSAPILMFGAFGTGMNVFSYLPVLTSEQARLEHLWKPLSRY